VSPPILRQDWKTLPRLTFRRSKPLDLDACPTLTFLRQFCGATDNPKPSWFWSPNQKIVAVILRHKSSNRSYQFWGPNQETWVTGFEDKLGAIVDLDFKAQPKNPLSSSPCARYIPHTASPDLLIIWLSSTCPLFDYPRSFALGLLLLPRSSSLPAISHLSPINHETSKHDFPHE
jgi:hypothetical protein